MIVAVLGILAMARTEDCELKRKEVEVQEAQNRARVAEMNEAIAKAKTDDCQMTCKHLLETFSRK
jgi:hypothetical protein